MLDDRGRRSDLSIVPPESFDFEPGVKEISAASSAIWV